MSPRPVVIALLLAWAGQASAQSDKAPHPHASSPTTAAVLLGANEIVGSVTQPGWPLIVSALLVPGADSTGAPVLAARPNLAVRLVDAGGARVAIALEAVDAPFADGEPPQWYWLAAGSATGALAPGRYRIEADTSGFAVAGLHASHGTLDVEAAVPGTDARARRLRLEAALLRGRVDDALAEARQWTAADSTDSDAWGALGDMLMGKDQAAEALTTYGRALKLLGPKAGEPLDLRRRKHAAFTRMLIQRGVLEAPATER